MKNIKKQSSEGGFSILEALVGSTILIFGLASVLAVATHGFRYIADMRRDARSSQVLQQRLEDIRLITVWTNVLTLGNTTFTDTNLPGTRFNGQVTVSAYPPYDSYGGAPIVSRVTLLVTWTNRNGKILTNRLSSLVCKDGLNSYIF